MDQEKAKIEAKVRALEEIADAACAEADKKIRALVKKWGWTPRSTAETKIVEMHDLGSRLSDMYDDAHTEYTMDGRVYERRFVKGPVGEAQKALNAFDEAVAKAARRLVVLKKDLNMQADAFDEAVAKAVAKLLGA